MYEIHIYIYIYIYTCMKYIYMYTYVWVLSHLYCGLVEVNTNMCTHLVLYISPQKIESKLPLCYWNSTSIDLGVTYLNMAYT